MQRSRFSASREGRGCTSRTCFSACREGRGCTPRNCLSACREGSPCTPRSRISACREGRGCTPLSCMSACRAGRGCTQRSCRTASHASTASVLPSRTIRSLDTYSACTLLCASPATTCAREEGSRCFFFVVTRSFRCRFQRQRNEISGDCRIRIGGGRNHHTSARAVVPSTNVVARASRVLATFRTHALPPSTSYSLSRRSVRDARSN